MGHYWILLRKRFNIEPDILLVSSSLPKGVYYLPKIF